MSQMTHLLTMFLEFQQRTFAVFNEALVQPIDELCIPLNSAIVHISTNVFNSSVSTDQLRLLINFIGLIPLGFILFSIRSPLLRHAFSLIVGLLSGIFVFQGMVIFAHIETLIVYALCWIFKRHAQRVVFGFALICSSSYQIYRLITNYGGWEMDLSLILMMNFCKYTSFAFCYADGCRATTPHAVTSPTPQFSSDQKLRAIRKLPNILTFFSYVNFMSSAIVGPVFDYYEFDLFINAKPSNRPPHPFFDTCKNLAIGAVYLAITALVLPQFPIDFILTNDFEASPFWWRILYFNLAIILIRIRYYAGWLLIQASCSATGITWSGDSKKFDSIVTVRESLEFSYEIRVVIEKWNSMVQVWLKRYVYYRLYSEEEYKTNKSKATYGQFSTMLTSALWHGFYPGYYVSFIQWAILIQVMKYLYRASINKREAFAPFEKLGILATFIKWFTFQTVFNQLSVGFVLLSIEKTWIFTKNVHFIGITAVLITLVFFVITGWGQRSPKTLKKD